MTTRLPFASYLDHLRIESEAFAVALADVPDDRQVPTCPDWTALDLAHHITEVQSFWAAVVSGPLLTDEAAEDVFLYFSASLLSLKMLGFDTEFFSTILLSFILLVFTI